MDEPGRPQIILGELRRLILDGAVPPGTVIPLREVAELFGVSHIPVREALKTLLGAGLVRHDEELGYVVAHLHPEELREMYIVRQALEEAALSAAVARATPAERATLAQTFEALEQTMRDDDPVAYHRQSRRFHLALTQPSQLFRLLHMLEAAWNVTEPVQPMAQVGQPDRMRLHTDHALMLDAFLNRDTPRLIAIAQRHHQRLESVLAEPAPAELAPPPDDISFAQ